MERSIDSGEILFTAQDLQRWRWQGGRKPGVKPPDTVIFCPQPGLLRRAKRRYYLKGVKGLFGDCQLLNSKAANIALVGGFGIGAPAMGIATEEYVAFGVRQFISVGIAGSLQPYLHTGDVVICDGAIRGEGTSGHYLPPSRLVEADSWLTNGIHSVLTGKGVHFSKGISWTTDAPYRETHREVDCYRKEGILTVEMEAAALFAVAKSLGARAAAVFIIADRLLPEGWEPPSQIEIFENSMDKVLGALIAWLANMDKSTEGTR